MGKIKDIKDNTTGYGDPKFYFDYIFGKACDYLKETYNITNEDIQDLKYIISSYTTYQQIYSMDYSNQQKNISSDYKNSSYYNSGTYIGGGDIVI